MGVAPVLPWRKASAELLRERLFWPAWMGGWCDRAGRVRRSDGWAPLVAFGLGGFAAGSAFATARTGDPSAGLQPVCSAGPTAEWSSHIGVILIAIAPRRPTASRTRPASSCARVKSWSGVATRSSWNRSTNGSRADNESKRVIAAERDPRRRRRLLPATTTYLTRPGCRHTVGANGAHRRHLHDDRSGCGRR